MLINQTQAVESVEQIAVSQNSLETGWIIAGFYSFFVALSLWIFYPTFFVINKGVNMEFVLLFVFVICLLIVIVMIIDMIFNDINFVVFDIVIYLMPWIIFIMTWVAIGKKVDGFWCYIGFILSAVCGILLCIYHFVRTRRYEDAAEEIIP